MSKYSKFKQKAMAEIAEKLNVPRDQKYSLTFTAVGLALRVAQAPRLVAVASKDFLDSYAWRSLRMVVLTKRGARCECCGATPKDGVRMNVDHIKPRLKFPELALEESNLQVLCEVCNHGKGNWDETDWRETDPPGSVM